MTVLRLLPGDYELCVHDGESILSAVCRAGFTYYYGCRRGGCGICKADMTSGEVCYPKTVAESVLSQQERADGVVLTCRAHAVSDDVVLQVRNANRLKLQVPLSYVMAQDEVGSEKRRQTTNPRNITEEAAQWP